MKDEILTTPSATTLFEKKIGADDTNIFMAGSLYSTDYTDILDTASLIADSYNIMGLNTANANILEIESNDCILIKESWLDFSLSLFPNARYFTKEEQEKFDAFKKTKFKKFKFKF